jgi:hypothetical protein
MTHAAARCATPVDAGPTFRESHDLRKPHAQAEMAGEAAQIPVIAHALQRLDALAFPAPGTDGDTATYGLDDVGCHTLLHAVLRVQLSRPAVPPHAA